MDAIIYNNEDLDIYILGILPHYETTGHLIKPLKHISKYGIGVSRNSSADGLQPSRSVDNIVAFCAFVMKAVLVGLTLI